MAQRSVATLSCVKVSGLVDPQEAALAVALGANAIGCVFWAKSERHVDLPMAWAIRQAIGSHVPMVGIFVDAPRPLVQLFARRVGLDQIQLFGREQRQELEGFAPAHAFKAVTVDRTEDIESLARPFVGGVHLRGQTPPAMLLHLRSEAEKAWPQAAAVAARAPILLASAAVDASSVVAVVDEVRPWGLDLWSAVERSPGRLDPDRLAALIQALSGARQYVPSRK